MAEPKNRIIVLMDKKGANFISKVVGGQSARVFQVLSTGNASVQMQASCDGKNWVSLGSAITASGGYESEAPWPYMRANMTWTSGTVTVWMAD